MHELHKHFAWCRGLSAKQKFDIPALDLLNFREYVLELWPAAGGVRKTEVPASNHRVEHG